MMRIAPILLVGILLGPVFAQVSRYEGLEGEELTGTYSSLCFDSVSGDLSGMEVTLFLGGSGYWALIQIAEGAPSSPIITNASISDSLVVFTLSDETGTIEIGKGSFKDGHLLCWYKGSTKAVWLRRQPSYWHRHAANAWCEDTTEVPTWRPYHTLYVPPNGLVPDSSTAVSVAIAAWLPIYGEEILGEEPFVAKLHGDSVWTVEGSVSEGSLGGTAYIEIRKEDGKILGVLHGK